MNRLKILRKEKGETQDQVAEVAGVSKRSYIYWENGERQIKPDKAQALADHFGVSVGYLLGYSEYRDQTEIKNLVYDVPMGGSVGGQNFDWIAQIIGEKRMAEFLEKTSTNDFVHFSFIDNLTNIQHTKEAELIIYFSLLDNSDKQLIFELVKSLSDKIIPNN
ncbi:TPA: helix-turn-helix transcriptional regulator [Streptococcus suis]|nr:helix-turn-helix transcriptional regulator [Streptococcus suis]HEM5141615.1 helix-turn-helix transcriptional regulator [Streptococcus suis]